MVIQLTGFNSPYSLKMKKFIYLFIVVIVGIFFAPKLSHAQSYLQTNITTSTAGNCLFGGNCSSAFVTFNAGTVGNYIGHVIVGFNNDCAAAGSCPPPPQGIVVGWNCSANVSSTACANNTTVNSSNIVATTPYGDLYDFNVATSVAGLVSIGNVSIDSSQSAFGISNYTYATNGITGFSIDRTCSGNGCTTAPYNVGSTGFAPYLVVNGVNTLSSVNFIYPTNGTTTPPFNNIWVGVSGVVSSSFYSLTVQYSWPQFSGNSTAVGGLGGALLGLGSNFPPQQFTVNGTGASLLAQGRLIPYLNNPFPSGAASPNPVTVNATATLSLVDPNTGALTQVDQEGITFYQIPNYATSTYYLVTNGYSSTSTTSTAPIYSLTTSTNPFIGITQNTVGSSTFYCAEPSNITDIGGGIAYGLCSAGNFFLSPSTNLTAYLQNGYQNIQNAFPFSIVFGIHNVIEQTASTTISEGQTNNYTAELSLGSTTPALAGVGTIVFLSSSTLVNLVGQQGKDTIFSVEDAIMWLLFGFALYKQVAHGKHA